WMCGPLDAAQAASLRSAAFQLGFGGPPNRHSGAALMTLIAIAYVSAASKEFGPGELQVLTQEWSALCSKEGVTGLLLHRGGGFAGLLEGEAEAATKVYATVKADTRHTRLIELLNAPSERREFTDWS